MLALASPSFLFFCRPWPPCLRRQPYMPLPLRPFPPPPPDVRLPPRFLLLFPPPRPLRPPPPAPPMALAPLANCGGTDDVHCDFTGENIRLRPLHWSHCCRLPLVRGSGCATPRLLWWLAGETALLARSHVGVCVRLLAARGEGFRCKTSHTHLFAQHDAASEPILFMSSLPVLRWPPRH